ncbi:uncharacterized protein LOC144032875 isoform X2 [Festucalex cinctus]
MNVNQRNFALRSGAEGDAARCIKDPAQACALPKLLPGQRPLQTKSYAYKAQEDKLNPYRRSEASKLKLPPIRDTAKLRELSANNIKELKNQNYVLQQQLKDSKTENKMLKNVLHRHTVALQQYQELDGSIAQIQEQHRNEVKALRKLLAETRSSRDKLARKLQSTERELLDCKDRITHLQWRVNQNPNLLEKEELTRRLSEFTILLEEKDRRIQFLEKSNILLQGSLSRHVATENKKMSKTNEMSLGLQSRVSELAKKTQMDRTQEEETNNINTIRSRKHGLRAKQSKMIQTDNLGSSTSEADSRIKSDISEPDDKLRSWQNPGSPDYAPRKSPSSEQRRKSRSHSEKAFGDTDYHQEKRRDSSEDTQESEEGEEEEDKDNQKRKDEDDDDDEERGNNNDGGGGGRLEENNGGGNEGKEEHDEEDHGDEGMDQGQVQEAEEEDETEGKEEKSVDTRLDETFEEMIGGEEEEERDSEEEKGDDDKEEQNEEKVCEEEDDAEKNYKEEEEDAEKNYKEKEEKKKSEDDDDEQNEEKVCQKDHVEKYEEEEEVCEEEDSVTAYQKKDEKQVVEELEEEENEVEEEEENIEVEENTEENTEVEENIEVEEGRGVEERGASEEREEEEVEEKVVEMGDEHEEVVMVEVKQQKRKEKGDQKDIRTFKKCSLSSILNEAKGVTQREAKRCSRSKARRKYNFTPITKNLHLGKPAHSGVHVRYHKGPNVPVKEETHYCRNRRRSAEMVDNMYLSDEQTSQPDAASDCSDLDATHNESATWT